MALVIQASFQESLAIFSSDDTMPLSVWILLPNTTSLSPGSLDGHTHEAITCRIVLDAQSQWAYIITAYEPDLEHFEPDYHTRKVP